MLFPLKLLTSWLKYFIISKRRLNLTVIQELSELKVHNILRMCDTRWLSYKNSVSRTLEQLTPLRIFFKDESKELERGFKLSSLQSIQLENVRYIDKFLNDGSFQLYLEFLEYILPIIVTNINQEFQAEKPKIYLLYSRMEIFSRLVLSNYMDKNYVRNSEISKIAFKDPKYFRNDTAMYVGDLRLW